MYECAAEPFPLKLNERVIYSTASHRGSRVLLAATDIHIMFMFDTNLAQLAHT